MTENPIIWQPDHDRIKKTAMYRFMKDRSFESYDDLYQWSIDNTADFWQALCDFCDVRFSKAAATVVSQSGDMTTAKWFSGSELSFAEHVLRYSGDRAAIIFRGRCRIESKMPAEVTPPKACVPVAISYRTAPKEKRSVRASVSSPRACSGDM